MDIGQMNQKQLGPIEFLHIDIVIVEFVCISKMVFALGPVRWAIIECLAAADAKVVSSPIWILIGVFNRDIIGGGFVDFLKKVIWSRGACEAGAGPAVWGKMPQVHVLNGCI
jgi:hypothetical protein